MDELLEDLGIPDLEPVAGFSGGSGGYNMTINAVGDNQRPMRSYYDYGESAEEDSGVNSPLSLHTLTSVDQADIFKDDASPIAKLPENILRLLMKAATDELRFPNLVSSVRSGILDYAITTNECEKGSEEANQLEKTLSELDPDTLVAAVGQFIIRSGQGRRSDNLNASSSQALELHLPRPNCGNLVESMLERPKNIEQQSIRGGTVYFTRNGVTSEGCQIIQKMFADPRQFLYILQQLKVSIVTAAYSLGIIKYGFSEADEFHDNLMQTNPYVLSEVVAEYFKSAHSANEANKTVQPGSSRHVVSMENFTAVQKPSSGPSPPKKFKSERAVQRFILMPQAAQEISVTQEVWEKACGLLNKDKLELICKALFKGVFTPDEIRRQTLSGKFGTEPFDPNKIAWTRAACAYIWSRPSPEELTAENFHRHWAEGLVVDIEEDKWKLVEKRVLTEYAFHLRSKYK